MEDIIKKMEELMAKAESENRSLSSDEQAEFDKLSATLEAKKATEERKASLEAAKASMDEVKPEQRAVEPSSIKVTKDEAENPETRRVAFVKHICRMDLTDKEKRALEVGVAAEGGNIVPTEFDTEVRERVRNLNPFRRLGAEVITTGSTRKIPVETTQPTAAVVAEEGAYGESDPAFGQLTLDAYKLGNIVKVSDELISDNFINLEQYLIRKFSEAIAYKEEDLIVSGSGSGETQGLIGTTSVAGISVSNTDITGSATAVTADDLKTIMYDMKPQYRNGASNLVWVMSNDSISKIAQLKDGDNRYLLNDSMAGISRRDDDMLLGAPIIVSDHMNDMAEDTVSFLLLDLRHLLIGDRGGLEVKTLDQLYAANGQMGFRFSKRFDSLLVNADAMVTGTNNAA